jgi:UPF0755 protein
MTPDPRPNPSRGALTSVAPAGDGSQATGANAGVDKRLSPRSPRTALEPERVPEPNRPSRRARHPIVVAGSAVFTVILLLAAVAGFGYAAGKQRFEAPGPLENARIVNIPRDLGLRDIADLLQRDGVIDQPWVFVGGVLVLKARHELKSGEYEFKRQASLKDVVDTIVEGKVYQHQLTIPEGLTSEQIVARLMEADVLAGNIKEIPKEGTILPETYKVTRGTSREQLIARMQQAQRRLLQEVWDHRASDLLLKTPDQLVVLASLIEKETAKPDERSRVAAVFLNRLKLRMRLQSDPTIIYGLVGGRGTLGRPILRSEIEQPTPYNTYVIDGLPPGPIANPGRASLEAAGNPARTKELFFVADGTGGHAFSETLEQHQKNVARLRALEQQPHGEEPLPAPTPPPAAKPPIGQAGPAPKPGKPARTPSAAPSRSSPEAGEGAPAPRSP